MSSNGSSYYNISGRIEDGLRFLGSAKLFLIELKEALEPYWLKTVFKSKTHFREVGSKLTRWDLFWGIASAGVLVNCLLVFFSGFCIIGYQTIDWLQNGVWEEIPLKLVFNSLLVGTAINEWLIAPNSWLGRHQLVTWTLENTPLSLILIVNGAILTFLFTILITTAMCFRYYQLGKL